MTNTGGAGAGGGGGQNNPQQKPNPQQAGGGPQPGQQPQAAGNNQAKDMSTNYVLAQINQSFKSDRVFHSVVSSKEEFRKLLGLVGQIPFKDRGQIARNIGAVVELNARLLQDTKVFEGLNTLMRNIPSENRFFQETAGKIMIKVREALIKNRGALDLYNPVMMEYSEVIRKFLAMVPAKAKGDFFSSLDEQILNFVLGKITKEQKQKHLSLIHI